MKTIEGILKGIRPEFDFTTSQDFIGDGMLDSFDVVTLVSDLDRTFGVDRVATMLLDRLVDLLVAPFQVLTPGAGWLPPTLQS